MSFGKQLPSSRLVKKVALLLNYFLRLQQLRGSRKHLQLSAQQQRQWSKLQQLFNSDFYRFENTILSKLNFASIRDQRLIFQTLSSISAEKNHTFVFPLPIDLVKGILGTGEGEDDEQHEDDEEEMAEKVISYGSYYKQQKILILKLGNITSLNGIRIY